MQHRYLIPGLLAAALVLGACTQSAPPPEYDAAGEAAGESTPAGQAPTAAAAEESSLVGGLDPGSTVSVSNRYAKISYDRNWVLIGQEGPSAPAFISLRRTDHLATVTIRIRQQRDGIRELCQSAVKVFAAEGSEVTEGPTIRGPNCHIRGIKNERTVELWLRKDQASGLAYSINFHGRPDAAHQVLSTLQGDVNIQELLIAPL